MYAYFLVVLSVLKSFCCFVGFSIYAECDDPKVGGAVLKTCTCAYRTVYVKQFHAIKSVKKLFPTIFGPKFAK